MHHGDGTQEIFYEDPEVLTVSLHRFEHEPQAPRPQRDSLALRRPSRRSPRSTYIQTSATYRKRARSETSARHSDGESGCR